MSDAQHEKREEQRSSAERTPLTLRTFESILDRRLAQAHADGLMDNLPGAGKPQRLDDDSQVPEGERAGFRLLKANDLAPPWIEARKEIDRLREQVDRWAQQARGAWHSLNESERAQVREEYRQRLHDLRRAILNHNLRLPPGVPQLANVRIEQEIARLDSER